MSLSTSLSIVNKVLIYRFLSGKLFLKKYWSKRKMKQATLFHCLFLSIHIAWATVWI
jgi:hypothetical protein